MSTRRALGIRPDRKPNTRGKWQSRVCFRHLGEHTAPERLLPHVGARVERVVRDDALRKEEGVDQCLVGFSRRMNDFVVQPLGYMQQTSLQINVSIDREHSLCLLMRKWERLRRETQLQVTGTKQDMFPTMRMTGQ